MSIRRMDRDFLYVLLPPKPEAVDPDWRWSRWMENVDTEISRGGDRKDYKKKVIDHLVEGGRIIALGLHGTRRDSHPALNIFDQLEDQGYRRAYRQLPYGRMIWAVEMSAAELLDRNRKLKKLARRAS